MTATSSTATLTTSADGVFNGTITVDGTDYPVSVIDYRDQDNAGVRVTITMGHLLLDMIADRIAALVEQNAGITALPTWQPRTPTALALALYREVYVAMLADDVDWINDQATSLIPARRTDTPLPLDQAKHAAQYVADSITGAISLLTQRTAIEQAAIPNRH